MSDNNRRPDPVEPLKGSDAFWLTDLYPDAKALFEHEQVSLDTASQDCIVVLDANVLLLPFEFSSASVGEVERVYKELCVAGRLIVPGQAAREFYKNRSNKITAIADALDAAITKAKKQVFEKNIPLLESDPDYIAARELGAEFVNKGKEIAEKLEAVNLRLKDEIGADRVSVLYRALLGGCIAEVSAGTDEERKAISDEVARRARLKIAPGYKDKQKEDGGIGDYLVWKSILQEGEKRQAHCVFVTEEEKPDWWIKRHGTFQPRPELIEEYRRASGGKSLHLVPLSGLLAMFKANAEVVKQVQDVEDNKKRHSGLSKSQLKTLVANAANNSLWSSPESDSAWFYLLQNKDALAEPDVVISLLPFLRKRLNLSDSEFKEVLDRYHTELSRYDRHDRTRQLRALRRAAAEQGDMFTLRELNDMKNSDAIDPDSGLVPPDPDD